MSIRRTAAVVLLALACSSAAARAQSPAPAPAVLDPAKDRRLAQRIRLRSEGLPVSWVLEEISAKTGVRMHAPGREGDERLVAFVPDAPLSDIMASIAALYRFTWLREGDTEPPRYRLIKSARAAREEELLRDRSVQELLAKTRQQLLPRDAGKAGYHSYRVWGSLYPDILALIAARAPELRRQLALRIQVGSLPPSTRAVVLRKLTPIIADQQSKFDASMRRLREKADASRGLPATPPPVTRASPPEDAEVMVELNVVGEPRCTVGLRSGSGTEFPWTTVRGRGLWQEAESVYTIRRAGTNLEAPAKPTSGDPLYRVIEIPPARAGAPRDWIDGLISVAAAAAAPVYADCYTSASHSSPRTGFVAPLRGSLAGALNRLGPPEHIEGGPSSFWWRRGDSALLRSRGWLWESRTVLPAALLRRLSDSIRTTGGIRPEDLPALAEFDAVQVQGLGVRARDLDLWRLGFSLTARLSLSQRARVLAEG